MARYFDASIFRYHSKFHGHAITDLHTKTQGVMTADVVPYRVALALGN
jgi:hypothetical protein